MRSRPSARRATRCESQILSNRVADMVATLPDQPAEPKRPAGTHGRAPGTQDRWRDAGAPNDEASRPAAPGTRRESILGGKKIHPRMSSGGDAESSLRLNEPDVLQRQAANRLAGRRVDG